MPDDALDGSMTRWFNDPMMHCGIGYGVGYTLDAAWPVIKNVTPAKNFS